MNILEALARAKELAVLDEHKVSNEVVEYWLNHKLFPKGLEAYSKIYMELNPTFGASTMVVLLLCSLRGSFFPFLERKRLFWGVKYPDIFIEDFHPVMLVERFISETRPFLGSENADTCRSLYRKLKKRHNLVDNPERFVENRTSLDFHFGEAYPDVSGSFQYQTYKSELNRIGQLRATYLASEAENVVHAIHDAVIKCDRFFASDCVFSTNDAVLDLLYTENGGPVLAYDRRLMMTAIGEWLAFGERSLLKEWRTIYDVIARTYEIRTPVQVQEEAMIQARFHLEEMPRF